MSSFHYPAPEVEQLADDVARAAGQPLRVLLAYANLGPANKEQIAALQRGAEVVSNRGPGSGPQALADLLPKIAGPAAFS